MNQARTHKDWETVLMGENLLIGLLGKILYAELDRTWLQTLIDEDVFSEAPFGESQAEVLSGLEYLQAWRKENQPKISDQAFLDLRTDYTRMFVGIQKVLVPVWESVYFSEKRMVFQEETLEVRNWYRRYKLESEKLYQEPDDHIGLELAFVAHLSQLGLQALEQNDETAFQQALGAQRDFLSEHLLRWGFKWAQLVDKHAKTNFYRGIGHLVNGALIEAASVVGAELPEEIKG
jgi:TorA maturation chaperone TorD